MDSNPLEIPPAWASLDDSILGGTVLVLGASDVGKSTFIRYLYQRLQARPGEVVAVLDGDPGQTSLGPPGTLTLTFDPQAAAMDGPPSRAGQRCWRYCVGSTSPRGHMLTMVVGAARLVQAGREAGAQTILMDTSGLIDPAQGGFALKSAKIDLLQPQALIAIQKEQELEGLLLPLKRARRTQVVRLKPAGAARARSTGERREHRRRQYERHFQRARLLSFDWSKTAVFPFPRFSLQRLVALEDAQGFTLALGIVSAIDRAARQVTLLAAWEDPGAVNALRLTDMLLDPLTFKDERMD